MQTKRQLLLLAVILIVTMTIVGCDNSVPISQPAPASAPKAVDQATTPPDNAVPERTMQLIVYHATKDAMNLVPETNKVPINSHPARTAVELLLAGPKNQDLVSVMPPGTKLKNVTVKDHVAYVDFDDKLIKKNIGGSASEILLVGAIVNTLTEFPDIHQVQILVDGKKVETIAGHMDTSEPLSRSEQIIKKQ